MIKFSKSLIIPLAIVALTLTGCKKGAGIPGVSQVAQVTQRVTESDFNHIQDATLRRHLVAQLNRNSARIKSTSSDKGTYDITEYELSGNDFNYHMTSNDGKKDIAEIIVIGDTTYLKDYSDGKWWKQKAQPTKEEEQKTEKINPQTESKKAEEDTKKETFKGLGKEACGNLTCFKYQQLTDNKVDRTFWFDDKDYLLRKEEVEFGEFKTTNEYSYDNISVKAPSPTKDVPAGKNIYEYYNIGGAMPQNTSGGNQPQYTMPSLPPANQNNPPQDQSGGDY